MAEVSKIQGYDIKDAKARKDIEELKKNGVGGGSGGGGGSIDESVLEGYAKTDHTHDEYLTEKDLPIMSLEADGTLVSDGIANVEGDFVSQSELDEAVESLQVQISNIGSGGGGGSIDESVLEDYAKTDHTHDEYLTEEDLPIMSLEADGTLVSDGIANVEGDFVSQSELDAAVQSLRVLISSIGSGSGAGSGGTGDGGIIGGEHTHEEYVKKDEYATSEKGGIVKCSIDYSIGITSGGFLRLIPATTAQIAAKITDFALTTKSIDYAVKVGVTTNTIQLTDEEKKAACKWLGASTTFDDGGEINLNLENGDSAGSVQQKGFQSNSGTGILGAIASGEGAVAFGGQRYDKAGKPVADEPQTEAKGKQSLAAGGGCITHGAWGVALGKENIAYQKSSFSMGGGNQAGYDLKRYQDDYGYNKTQTDCDNDYSFAFVAGGERNKAVGYASFSTGSNNLSRTTNTFTAGQNNEAIGRRSTVFGYYNYTYSENGFVIGQYNKENTNAFFIVGNGTGTGDSRSNAFEVLKDGRAKVYGKPTEENDVVRKKELDEAVFGDIDFSLLLKDYLTKQEAMTEYVDFRSLDEGRTIANTACFATDDATKTIGERFQELKEENQELKDVIEILSTYEVDTVATFDIDIDTPESQYTQEIQLGSMHRMKTAHTILVGAEVVDTTTTLTNDAFEVGVSNAQGYKVFVTKKYNNAGYDARGKTITIKGVFRTVFE